MSINAVVHIQRHWRGHVDRRVAVLLQARRAARREERERRDAQVVIVGTIAPQLHCHRPCLYLGLCPNNS